MRTALSVQTNKSDAPAASVSRPSPAAQRTQSGHTAPAFGALAVQPHSAQGGSALPHYERIQQAFGRHAIGDVRARVDASATAALQARAYARDSEVVFAQTPDLRTAAHEAAHVVQQRSGVARGAALNTPGDAWERHADRVANAVVAGRNAQPLLDAMPSASRIAAVQRDVPAGSDAPKPASDADAAQTDGERMREAVLAAAKGWLNGEDFISQQHIDDIRAGIVRIPIATGPDGKPITMAVKQNKPMPNYTTCIEFAGQVYADAVNARNKGNAKGRKQQTALLSGLMKIFNEETELHASIEAFRKSFEIFVKPEARLETQRAGVQQKIKDITDNGELSKQDQQQLAGQRGALEQIKAATQKIAAQKAKIQRQIDQAQTKLDDLHTRDKAWIKAKPGLAGDGPKPGDQILWGQPKGQNSYGVTEASTVTLNPGSFKHISTFQEGADAGKGYLSWKTIDGGGTHAAAHEYFVRKADLLAFRSIPPDSGPPPPQYQLLGWIDIAILVDGGAQQGAKP